MGLAQSYANLQNPSSGTGVLGGALGSPGTTVGTGTGLYNTALMKGIGTVGGLGMGAFNIYNTMNDQKEAKKQWEAENSRANEIMAMNKEKYNTYKADKSALNASYGGN